MDAGEPAEAVEILDLLLKFFGEGERWIKGRFSDRRGNCSLVGALDFVSSHHAVRGAAAERYLADVISDGRDRRPRDHTEGADYAPLRAALRVRRSAEGGAEALHGASPDTKGSPQRGIV